MPEFLARQSEKKLHRFWPALWEDWVNKFHERQGNDGDLTPEEGATGEKVSQSRMVGRVYTYHGRQRLANWFDNFEWRGDGALTPEEVAANIAAKRVSRGRRV